MSNPIEPLDMSDMKNCVGALTVEATLEHAMKHGACKISESVSKLYNKQMVLVTHTHTLYIVGRDISDLSHGPRGGGKILDQA